MAQLLNRMERDGLIVRLPDPADRQSRLIALTAQALLPGSNNSARQATKYG
jgi:MarR family transcriptional regulator, transcriptional regulator for hemolysin